MAYSFQSFSVSQVLTAAQMNQVEANVRDHVHGQNSVSDWYVGVQDAGASDAYAVTVSPAPGAYVTGMVVVFKANTANTGNATLNVNSLGAKNILKHKDVTLANNNIKAGAWVVCIYDGTNFQLVSALSAGITISDISTATGNASVGAGTNFTVDRYAFASPSIISGGSVAAFVGDGTSTRRWQSGVAGSNDVTWDYIA